MNDDYIPQPRPPLCDRAAAELLDFLYDLVTDFESAYAAQIRRYHDQLRSQRWINPAIPADPDNDEPPF